MSELNLPSLPKNYLWEIEVYEKKMSGALCFKISLKRRSWFGYDTLESGKSDDLSPESVLDTAEYLWEKYHQWLAAKKLEGIYRGNNSNRSK